jgi:hypothetical protein
MIVVNAKYGAQFNLRADIEDEKHVPKIEIGILQSRNSYPIRLFLSTENAIQLANVLGELVAHIDEHTRNLDISMLHPRADTLLADAGEQINLKLDDTMRIVDVDDDGWPDDLSNWLDGVLQRREEQP